MPQPQNPTPDASVQPIAESPEPIPDAPDERAVIEDDIWSRLRQADTHTHN